jgi:S-adenosylhomocysteine hydrolase
LNKPAPRIRAALQVEKEMAKLAEDLPAIGATVKLSRAKVYSLAGRYKLALDTFTHAP